MDLEFQQLDLRYEGLRVRRPERERRLLSSLAEKGQQVPVVVVALPGEPDRYVLIDGYKRVRALRKLGGDTVRVTVWEMEESEALVLDRSMRTAEAETALEQGWLLRELHDHFRLGLEELAVRFDRSVSWVSRRLALVKELPDSIQQWVRDGKIGSHAAMKYLVPMARAKVQDCQRLAQEIAQQRFGTQEVGVLYAAWRDGSFTLRERILESPQLFLRARQEMKQEEPIAAQQWPVTLDRLAESAQQALRQWPEVSAALGPVEVQNAWESLQTVLGRLQRLSQQIEKEKEKKYVTSTSAYYHTGTASAGVEQASDCSNPEDLPVGRSPSHWVGLGASTAHRSLGESRALSAGDPAALCLLSRQLGPGP